MNLSKETTVEIWTSPDKEEVYFYVGNELLLAFNPKFIQRARVAKFFQDLGYKIDPEKWIDDPLPKGPRVDSSRARLGGL